MTPTDILTAFFDEGQHLAAVVAPYALHLLYLLILVEILTLGITWMTGSDDPAELLWRIVRLLFTGGFAFWWLTNAWALGLTVLGSFHMLGQQISNAKALTPSAFIDVGTQIFKILWTAPSTARLVPNIALGIGEIMIAIVIMILLVLIAALCMFWLASAMLILGPGSIFVSFMPCRFTSSLSENYFIWLIRTGAAILGFFVVLATCQQFAVQWHTTLADACGAVLTTLPAPHLGGPPVAVSAVTCTLPIPIANLLTLFADVLIVAIIGIGVPFEMASLAGHGVHLALEHLASARYLAGSVARPLARAMSGMAYQLHRMTRSNNQSRLEQRLAAGASAAAATRPNQSATIRLPKPSAVNAFGVQSTKALGGSPSRPTSKI